MEATAASATEGRHASWLELFFDLVIVAAVAQLAHLLHDEFSLRDLFLFAVLYYAIWSVWVSFTLYANVSAQRTRQRAMLTAMFGIAVMAAAVPRAVHEQEQIFAIAYVACRLLASASWRGTGAVLTSWPAAQAGAGLVPWVVSIWVDAPARYWLWGIGVLADIVVSALQSRDPGRMFARYRDRAEEKKQRYTDRPDRMRRVPDVVEARLDTSHLGERLGLFVIIVLGEAVAQVVNVAADADWSRTLWWDVLAGFGLLVCLWWLTLEYGSTGSTRYGDLPPRISLPTHYVLTAGIVAMAAGLGASAESVDEALPTHVRWLLCGGAIAYFATRAVLAWVSGAGWRWQLAFGLPGVVVPALVGVFGSGLRAGPVTATLLVTAFWQTRHQQLAARLGARSA
jgi:low temperature requirement protein LtrA